MDPDSQLSVVSDEPIGLAEVFSADTVILNVKHHTRNGVIAELVRRLVDVGRISPEIEKSVVRMIIEREELGTTATGSGIAFPNCRCSATETIVGAVAISRHGTSFDWEQQFVNVAFLLVGPLTDRSRHFSVLSRLIHFGKQRWTQSRLLSCRLGEDVVRVLQGL